MGFQQAYYTSCETGLRNSKGFQINAATEGIYPAVLQQIERLGLYIAPVSAPSRPTPQEIDALPLTLLFQPLENGAAVLAQAKYVGADYSGRFGNYFTHSLITLIPATDFHSQKLLPIEAWRSATWTTVISPTVELPQIENLEAGALVSPSAVTEFLRRENRAQHLPAFLTAVEFALKNRRQIVIVDDSDKIAFWIAAASYALPHHLVLRLSFNTYVKNPYQTDFLIVGTTEDSDFRFAPHEIERQFFVFDFKGNRFTPFSENSPFARKVSALYQAGEEQAFAGFKSFIEKAAPDLAIEELDSALSFYVLNRKLNLSEIDSVKVLVWCAGCLKYLPEEDTRKFFEAALSRKDLSRETVEACINLYLAATDEDTALSLRTNIEASFLEWLIKEVLAKAPLDILRDAVSRLTPDALALKAAEPFREYWIKRLNDTRDAARLCLLLNFGAKFGLLAKSDELLQLVGETAVAAVLSDVSVQDYLTGLADRAGAKDLIYGTGNYLAEKTDDSELFKSLNAFLANPDIRQILLQYVSNNRHPALAVRLAVAEFLTQPGDGNKTAAFEQSLELTKRLSFDLTPELLDTAYDSIWENNAPTVEEALRLLDLPIPPPVIKFARFPAQFVRLVEESDFLTTDPRNKQLIVKLYERSSNFAALQDKRLILEAYKFAGELQIDDSDRLAARIDNLLKWLNVNLIELGEVRTERLSQSAAVRLLQIKNIEHHAALLLTAAQNRSKDFFIHYVESVESSLENHSKSRALTLARLVASWALFEQHDNANIAQLLSRNLLPQVLKNWRSKELDAVEQCLVQNPQYRFAHEYWRRNCPPKTDTGGTFGFVKRLFK
ncbi:MAG TPA: GTPase-associated protein 1-related protein [Pyrinomonadaceae bacterium]|jgi:hypothetical protein